MGQEAAVFVISLMVLTFSTRSTFITLREIKITKKSNELQRQYMCGTTRGYQQNQKPSQTNLTTLCPKGFVSRTPTNSESLRKK